LLLLFAMIYAFQLSFRPLENWPKKTKRTFLLQARAIENQVYILGVNCVGNMGGLEYSGDSCVINPMEK